MQVLAPGVTYYDRADWDADPAYPRLGGPDDPRNPGNWTFVPAWMRTERIMHHTVIIDSDATPNLWESVEEVFVKMRQLQTIRPDLGLDVPYNFVIFLMANGTIIVCEGRGHRRWGAHTIGHNDQIAAAIEGNTELFINMDPYIDPIAWFWGWLEYDMGLDKLGTVTPDADRAVFGHRDFSQTVCPGESMWLALPRIEPRRYEPVRPPVPVEEKDSMKLFLVHYPIGSFYYVVSAIEKHHAFNLTTVVDRLRIGALQPGLTEIDAPEDYEIVRAIPDGRPIL